jgi:hypothetical protein
VAIVSSAAFIPPDFGLLAFTWVPLLAFVWP